MRYKIASRRTTLVRSRKLPLRNRRAARGRPGAVLVPAGDSCALDIETRRTACGRFGVEEVHVFDMDFETADVAMCPTCRSRISA